jgi:hypothetical protein
LQFGFGDSRSSINVRKKDAQLGAGADVDPIAAEGSSGGDHLRCFNPGDSGIESNLDPPFALKPLQEARHGFTTIHGGFVRAP